MNIVKSKEVINMPDQHVTRHKNGGWQVKGAGDSKVTSKHDTQKQAIDLC